MVAATTTPKELIEGKTPMAVDTDSTESSPSEGEPTVHERLVGIPQKQGLANVQKLMTKDMFNRYQAKEPAMNFLLDCERRWSEYIGMRYALSLNSGGTAISLGLEALKRVCFPEDTCENIRVYSNAFTFHAVPSACVEAGFRETLRLIEATPELVIDLDHLERCIKEDLETGKFAPGKMILVLSYMRGRVPNMHRVMELCTRHDIKLLEDSAHGYGCSYDGRKCGSFGLVSTISTQANKLVNTGEGGIVLTSNEEMQAFFIFSAGSYEELWRRHEDMAPSEEVALKYKYTVSNKSVRMTNIQGALMLPQMQVMDDRIEQHNSMYYLLVERTAVKMEEICGAGAQQRILFIPQVDGLVGPVYDSLQIRILKGDGSVADSEFSGLNDFLKTMQALKYSIAKFSDPANARNYLSWQYLKPDEILPQALPETTRALLNVCDLRLLCHDTDVQMEKLATDLAECFKASLLKCEQ